MIRALSVKLHVIPLQTRMPFRYGIATMTRVPHLIVRLEAEVDGRPVVGQASDLLPPKWFTKDPTSSLSADLRGMLAVIEAARANALQLGNCASVFEFWRRLYDAQAQWARGTPHPPLLWHFGVSLIERAAIDAFCRGRDETFAQAVHLNTLGVDLGSIHPELASLEPTDLLPAAALPSVRVRHTVGLSDPLTDDDILPEERLDDGLPQSLETSIRTYGLTYFKIKLSGKLDDDIQRLLRVAQVLERDVGERCRHTLDGNEQFREIDEFHAFWDRLAAEPRLHNFLSRLIFVEQPIHRDEALSDAVGHATRMWPQRPAIIIDESDATLESLPQALTLGYAGTSHKNCKGVCKGIANACLLAHRRARGERVMMSGEDLANVGPIALLQDLAVAATLGIDHVERNGHHYFRGLTEWPGLAQSAVLKNHPDLYHRQEDGYPTLTITGGTISVASAIAAPFGQRELIDMSQLSEADEATVQAAIAG